MGRLTVPDLAERWILPVIASLVTLAIGVLHLRLDYILYHGTVWGTPKFHGPPAGARPPGAGPGGPPPDGPPPGAHAPSNPFPFQLNEMFFLNFLSAIALVLAFWIAYRWFRRWLWLVDLGMIGFGAYSLWGWYKFNKPNPQGLGHISEGLEIALIVIVVLYLMLLVRHLAFPAAGQRRGALGAR